MAKKNKPKITKLQGILEINHDRGVIYFHLADRGEMTKRNVVTVLRIGQLPKPIPEIKERGLEILYMEKSTDWEGI